MANRLSTPARTTFKLEGNATQLIATEPKYGSEDFNCCPSQLRIGTLRWSGRAFRRTFRIEDCPSN